MQFPSPRLILLGGAVGAALAGLIGFHLGRPLKDVQVLLLQEGRISTAKKETPAPVRMAAAGNAGAVAPREVARVASAHEKRNDRRSEGGGMVVAGEAAPAPATAPKGGEAARPAFVRAAPAATPKWPLVIQLADAEMLSSAGLPPLPAGTMQQLQDVFEKEVGGTGQNPADPAYAQRWVAASQHADELLRAQIGWTAFNTYSMAAAQGSAAAK